MVPAIVPPPLLTTTFHYLFQQYLWIPRDKRLIVGALVAVYSTPLCFLLALHSFQVSERCERFVNVTRNISRSDIQGQLTLLAYFFSVPLFGIMAIHFLYCHFFISVSNEFGIQTLGLFVHGRFNNPEATLLDFLSLSITSAAIFVVIIFCPITVSRFGGRYLLRRLAKRGAYIGNIVERRPFLVPWIAPLRITDINLAVYIPAVVGVALIFLIAFRIAFGASFFSDEPFDLNQLPEAFEKFWRTFWFLPMAAAFIASLMCWFLGVSQAIKPSRPLQHVGRELGFGVVATSALMPPLIYGFIALNLATSGTALLVVSLFSVFIGGAFMLMFGFFRFFGEPDSRLINCFNLGFDLRRKMSILMLTGFGRLLPVASLVMYYVWVEDGLRRAFGYSTFPSNYYNNQAGYPAPLRWEVVLALLFWVSIGSLTIALVRITTLAVRRVLRDGRYGS